MKNKVSSAFVVFCAMLVATVLVFAGCNAPSDMVTKNFADTRDVLLNPGKGFVDYGTMIYRDDDAADYVAVGYHRFRWSDIEPEEGQINFEKIDSKINSYAKRNKKFAFGIMSVNTSLTEEYVTPKYVFDKGAKSFDARLDGGTYQKVPDWKDPIYIGCVSNFVKKLGERYNGDKNVAFIDILSYGNWGEQHLFHLEIEGYPDYREKEAISPEFFRANHVQPYMDAFPDTLLFNPWGVEEFDGVYEALIDEGVSLRRDGIVSYTNGLDSLAKCYGKLPVAFEYAGNYKDYLDGREQYFNERLEEAVGIAKPSYIELDEDWFEHNKDYCADLANRMGYYFRLKQARYHENLSSGVETEVELTFRNDGIAPIYEKCIVYVALLDENGNVVEKQKTDLDPKTWLPGETVVQSAKATFNAAFSEYTLAIGLFADESDERLAYLLGSEGITANNWYALGGVVLSA